LSFYLDTSLLVSALTREAATAKTQAWLGSQSLDSLFISDWVITEFSSALSIKLRTGQISAPHRAEAMALFNRHASQSFTTVSIGPEHFRLAARFADRHELSLRAGDALHLAVAGENGLRMISLDRKLVDAAIALGISAALLP
jgi:predicted nucleic acid-binding protein